MKKRAVIGTILATMILMAALWLAPRETIYRKSRQMMSTDITITIATKLPPANAETVIDNAFDEIERIEKEMSFWTEDSEIAFINKYAGMNPVKVSPRTLEVVETSLEIAANTGGGFDPTVGPLIALWDHRAAKVPSKEKIASELSKVDYRQVLVDKAASTVMLAQKGMSFDTGGIAKGYATDMAVEKLKEQGIKSGLVAVAGDIRAFGARPDGRPWTVGIRDPRSDSPDDIIAQVSLMDYAISTSGDYERYFIKDGKRYHHIIDPATGMPSEGLMSVSVLSPRSVLSDGYATGIFARYPREAIATLERMKLDGIVIDTNGKVSMTRGLEGWIQWTSDKYEAP